MYKPDSLRKHLTDANPDLQRNPDSVLVFVDKGHLVNSGAGSLSFEYRYQLNIIITDFAGDEDAIMVPLLAWIAIHQVELMHNPDLREKGIRFVVDYNNHESVDLSIELDLTERVVVSKSDNGRLDIRHRAEPQETPDYDQPFWTLNGNGSLLAEWHTPEA